MDKYEYKVRADEIKSLIAEGEYAEAVKIADTIDWRRVRSVMMLCTVSDLYKINRRYQESKEILLMANDKRPSGRAIVYSLCELSIKMDDLIDAVKYYKEFVEIAPRDTGKYVLLYRLYEAQDVSLEERIAVLEEFKKRDYREKWAYELAYLYHRIGLTTKCIEECDEMYLWFGEGAYVLKALELKALHVPLNAEQQEKHDLWIRQRDEEMAEEEEEAQEDESKETSEVDEDDKPQTDSHVAEDSVPVADKADSDIMTIPTTELPEVKTVDVGQYNTINLQMVVAEGMKELMPEESEEAEPAAAEEAEEEAQTQIIEKVPMDPETEPEPESEVQSMLEPEEDLEILQLTESEFESSFSFEPVTATEPELQPEVETEPELQPVIEPEADLEIQQLTESEYESPFNFEPVTETEPEHQPEPELEIQPLTEPEYESPFSFEPVTETESEPQPVIEPEPEPEPQPVVEPEPEYEYQFSFVSEPKTEPQPVIEPEPIHNNIEQSEPTTSIAEQLIAPLLQETAELPNIESEISEETIETRISETPEIYEAPAAPETLETYETPAAQETTETYETPTAQEMPKTNVRQGVNWVRYDDVLSQEYDGQIRLVVPDEKVIEKQITGQLSIEDIMAEWEEMKKSNEQKRMEDVRKRILSRTGSLFADFDEATRNGLLEELEKAFAVAMMQESDRESAIKKVVYPSGIESKLNSEMKTKLQQAVADVASETAEAMLSDEAADEVIHNDEVEVPEVIAEPEEAEKPRPARELTNEEQELFGRYAQNKKSKDQIVDALDNMSMAAYTGNIIITGEDDGTTMPLAKNLIREMQYNDSNFSGKVAKISAAALNKKEIAETLTRLSNGALIIERAADLNEITVTKLNKVLENENIGLFLILEDTKKRINNLLSSNESLTTCINLRIDIEPLDDEALVAYAKKYAEENEYSIDEFGVLALHTRIADMQTSDHEVSVSEVRELVDNAIYYANKKTPRHFLDILLAKRYDKEDMIILREMDFMHY